jgi:hypothetical protein
MEVLKMFSAGSRAYLRALILAASFFTLVVAEEAERLPGPTEPSTAGPPPVRKKWRRVVVSCEKCDGGQTAPVTVFTGHNGEGTLKGLNTGVSSASNGKLGGGWDNNISSLAVADGYTAKLCTQERGGRGAGRCENFGPGEHNLSGAMDKQTSFVTVRR